MSRTKWTTETTAALAELFPVETTAYTAGMLGMSQSSVKAKAGELGIAKGVKRMWTERAEHISRHFHEHSFSEMALHLGISKMSVTRIAARLGLKRTREQNRRINCRVRSELIRRERRRVIFGLDPVTRIKVVTNRARVELRSRLKRSGYLVRRGHNILYYPAHITRREAMEHRGAKLGLKFLPLAGTGESLSLPEHPAIACASF